MVKGDDNVGGLIGTAAGEVEKCYAAGPVFGDQNTGGFLGELQSAAVKLSYSWGFVSSLTPGFGIGGFIGFISGGGSVIGCIYNPESSAQTRSIGIGSESGCTSQTNLRILGMSLGSDGDWYTSNDHYYPQLSVFANNSKNLNISYCSALSVVPVTFAANETAAAVKTAFAAPVKYAIRGVEREHCVIVPRGGSATCSVVNGKVFSTLPTGVVDTLEIKMNSFELPGADNSAVGIRERSRKICFAPLQLLPACTPVRTQGLPNENGWSKKNVVYTLQSNADHWIGGPAKFQHSVVPLNSTGNDNWNDITGNTDLFDRDTTNIKVQYRALNGAGGAGTETSAEPINIDKTLPVISDISVAGDGSRENPVQGHATVSVRFKDELSGIAVAEWKIGNPQIAGDLIGNLNQITHDAQGYLNVEIALPSITGNYPFRFTVTDKAGNKISNDENGNSVDIYVVDDNVNLNDYILDSAIVDGDTAILRDNNDLYVYETTVCITEETAHLVLTPKPIFDVAPIDTLITGLNYGDNPIEITVVSKDGKVAQTFVIHICREALVASFLSLSVNGNLIKIKPDKYDYSVPSVNSDVEQVRVDYTLADGEACNRTPDSSTVFDPTSPYNYDFSLEPGQNILSLTVRSADGSITKKYNVSIYRNIPNLVVDDDVSYGDGNFEIDPDADNPTPWLDKDGNIVYDLVSICDTQDHYIKVTPETEGLTVTFDGVQLKDNTYRFDIANRYTVHVVVGAEPQPRSYIFNVVKKFNKDDIFYFRWNDVISVMSNPIHNGGYSFTNYEWYLNGVANQETRSYLEVKNGNVVEALLSGAHKTGTEEVALNEVPTCPCTVGASTQANIRSYPSVLKAGEKVTVSTENKPAADLKDGDVHVVDLMGNRVGKFALTGSKTDVAMPDVPGIYLLKVSTKSVQREFKVILK
jgi:hypothetical protein